MCGFDNATGRYGDAKAGSISMSLVLPPFRRTLNRYIRRLLYLGAMGVISARRLSEPGTDWLGRLIATKLLKVAAIALANRMARAIWAMLKTGEAWRPA